RRHTRFSRDWSSDVCSSDLLQFHLEMDAAAIGAIADACAGELADGGRWVRPADALAADAEKHGARASALLDRWLARWLASAGERSEERRVGRECRWRCPRSA